MSETILSHRLERVASYIPTGSRLLDVGSDHAYLPLYLLERGAISHAIAGEVVDGPYQSALKNAQQSRFAHQLEVRLADGLAAFEPADAIDTIAICGMGGRLIASILDKGRAKLSSVHRLVLQPNNREDDLRRWLSKNGFQIVAEEILTENDKTYEIIVAQAGEEVLSEQAIRFGVFLPAQQSPVFVAKWAKERHKLETALTGIPAHHEATRSAITQKIQAIKEVLDES